MHSAPQSARHIHFRAIASMTTLKMAPFPLRPVSHGILDMLLAAPLVAGPVGMCAMPASIGCRRVWGHRRREITIESYPSASSLDGEHGA
jgi:hypothetical protein